METVLNFFFWFIVGWILLRVLSNATQGYLQTKIEEHSGCFYIFDNETDQFLGQGRTAEEFAERLSRDMTIKIVAGDPDVVKRFRATVPQIEAETA